MVWFGSDPFSLVYSFLIAFSNCPVWKCELGRPSLFPLLVVAALLDRAIGECVGCGAPPHSGLVAELQPVPVGALEGGGAVQPARYPGPRLPVPRHAHLQPRPLLPPGHVHRLLLLAV